MRVESPTILPAAAPRGAAPLGARAQGPSAPTAVLSADELAYFAELERMGPLVYGRRGDGAKTTAPPVLGHRIDVKA